MHFSETRQLLMHWKMATTVCWPLNLPMSLNEWLCMFIVHHWLYCMSCTKWLLGEIYGFLAWICQQKHTKGHYIFTCSKPSCTLWYVWIWDVHEVVG